MDLTLTAAYSNKAPYALWQDSEGMPIVPGHCVEGQFSITDRPLKEITRLLLGGGTTELARTVEGCFENNLLGKA